MNNEKKRFNEMTQMKWEVKELTDSPKPGEDGGQDRANNAKESGENEGQLRPEKTLDRCAR